MPARAASTSAWAWRTRYSKVSGSICAISCPAFTSELKSTSSSLIWPETWVPTDTWVTGLTEPLAETVADSGPRSIFAVRYCTAAASSRCSHHHAPAAPSTTNSRNHATGLRQPGLGRETFIGPSIGAQRARHRAAVYRPAARRRVK